MKPKKYTNIMPWKELKDGDFNSYTFICRGCSMRNREEIWLGYVSSISAEYNKIIDNSYLQLEEEPDNTYDSNAIMVVVKGECFGVAGYVGKEYTEKIKHILGTCLKYRIDVETEYEYQSHETELRITWSDKSAGSEGNP